MSRAIDIKDFSNICQTCLNSTNKMISITVFNIKNMIEECITVQALLNKFPQQICSICFEKLEEFYKFKQACLQSYEQLLSIIQKTKCFKDSVKQESVFIKCEENDFADANDSDIETQPKESAYNLKKDELERGSKKIKKYTCEYCEKDFRYLSKIAAHYKTRHNVKPTKCPQCPTMLYHPLQPAYHMKSVHETLDELVCDICGRTFGNKYRLKYHKVLHTNERPFHCALCPRNFKQKSNLKKHTKICHDPTNRREICNICGKLLLPISLRKHLETHNNSLEGRLFSCGKCDKTYKSSTALSTHVREKHSSNTEFVCKICKKVFISKRTLSKHMNIVHSEMKKTFGCHICGKKYKLKGHIQEHIRTAHLDVRPHACAVCSKAFHTKRLLQNHMRTHTGERPFACAVCGKRFGFKNVLNSHMKVHSK